MAGRFSDKNESFSSVAARQLNSLNASKKSNTKTDNSQVLDPEHILNIDRMKSILTRSIKITYDRSLDSSTESGRNIYKERFRSLCMRYKHYGFTNPKTITPMMDQIVVDATLLDMVLSLRVIFFSLYTSESGLSYDKIPLLIKHIAFLFTIPNTQDSLLNSEVVDRFSLFDHDKVTEILISNDFLVPIFLISAFLTTKEFSEVEQ